MLRETVKLSGFSTLEVRSRGERPGRNPLTGEMYPHPCSFELACAPVPNRRNAGAMATCSHQHIRTAFWATLTNSGQSMCLPAAEGLLATLFRPFGPQLTAPYNPLRQSIQLKKVRAQRRLRPVGNITWRIRDAS